MADTKAEGVRMVAFRTHIRDGVRINRGDEFEASEREANKYASRENPLAGPLGEGDVGTPTRRSAPRSNAARSKRTGRK